MNPEQILLLKKIKRTSCREGIIELILNSKTALSENEIKDNLSQNYDRTTFYRSFKTLLKKNIIHKIVVDKKTVKYAIDNSISEKHEHAHFYCTECGNVKCMDSVIVKTPNLPDGYIAKETEVIIKGICQNCNN